MEEIINYDPPLGGLKKASAESINIID